MTFTGNSKYPLRYRVRWNNSIGPIDSVRLNPERLTKPVHIAAKYLGIKPEDVEVHVEEWQSEKWLEIETLKWGDL